MRRTSQQAQLLVAALAAEGVEVTGRRLETWSQQGLLPPASTSHERTVEHCRHLASLLGPGKGNASQDGYDRAALALAGRGFACDRYRDAYCRAIGYSSAAEHREKVAADGPGESVRTVSDDGSLAVEQFGDTLIRVATDATLTTTPALRTVAPVMKTLLGGAKPQGDPVTGRTETKQNTVSDAANGLSALVIADMPASTASYAALTGQRLDEMEATESSQLGMVTEAIGGNFGSDVEQVTATASVRDLAEAASMARSMFLASYPDDESTDILAGMMAPGVLTLIRRLQTGPGTTTS